MKALDALAQEFVATDAKQRRALLATAHQAADAIDTSASPDMSLYVEYYIKIMQRIRDKGDDYLQQVSRKGVTKCCLLMVAICPAS